MDIRDLETPWPVTWQRDAKRRDNPNVDVYWQEEEPDTLVVVSHNEPEGNGWHISLSCIGRWPRLETAAAAIREFIPDDVSMGLMERGGSKAPSNDRNVIHFLELDQKP